MARKSLVSAALVKLMAGGKRHAWTLEELQADLARHGTATDFSSVFRAAEKLVADGAVRKLVLDDGRARLEPVGAHHDHLHCTRCDDLIAVPCVIPRGTFTRLEALTGGAIAGHRVVFSGICRSCRRSE